MVSSPIKDVPVLGPALGSRPVQTDVIPCACLCCTPWGCGFWALLCCLKRFKISALRSSSVHPVCENSTVLVRSFLVTDANSSFHGNPFLFHCAENLSMEDSV